jgi:hypothetical protein
MLRYVWNILSVLESRNTKEPNSIYYKYRHFWSFFDDSEIENVDEGIKCRQQICDMKLCGCLNLHDEVRNEDMGRGGVRYCSVSRKKLLNANKGVEGVAKFLFQFG